MSERDGVLGRLPRTRPGVASPRRVVARRQAAHQASGFEELARAGAGLATVTVVAGAQLTGRVLGEMAKAVGRR
jgi:hypothetical protein